MKCGINHGSSFFDGEMDDGTPLGMVIFTYRIHFEELLK
jgi:hypothetical protein